jgi:gluconokinase
MPSSPGDQAVLAIDVGSSSVRAALYTLEGEFLKETLSQHAYRPRTTPDGGVTVDALLLLELCFRAIDGALEASEGKSLAAVGFTCFWHGLLGLDERREPVTEVVSWADTRPESALPGLRSKLDPREYHARTGAFLHSCFWPAKLSWFGVGRAAAWCGPAEFILSRLTGEGTASPSMASGTGLLRVDQLAWDEETLDALGLDDTRLPSLSEDVRTLTKELASRWPALAGAPWAPPLGDGAAANLGSGCTSGGAVNFSFGTSAALRAVTDRCPSPPDGLFAYRLSAERWLVGGAVSNAGNAWAWLEKVLGKISEDEIDFSRPTPLVAVPALAGERAPDWREDATSCITGLSLAAGRSDIARAVLEGVALGCRRVHDRILAWQGPARVVATGGAVQSSSRLPQLLADALGVPVDVIAEPEASLRGAAISAITSLGLPEPAPPPAARTVQPNPERHEELERVLARQDRIRYLGTK